MILKGKKIILQSMISRYIPIVLSWYNNPKIRELEFISGKVKKEDIIDRKGKNFLIYADTTPVGFINLEINNKSKWANLGILINRDDWGNGYGREAMKLIIDFCFNNLKLNRIELNTYNHNIRAQKFFKKLGFKKEGVKKEFLFYKGKYYNAILMAILRRGVDKK